MGVVYKFKQEVIDFIIQKKKEEPLTSCRLLSSIASDKFQIELSKSSVNSILKNSKLSSAVGRRPGPKSKKFQIPKYKKKQIFDSIVKTGFEIYKENPNEEINVIEEKENTLKEEKQDFVKEGAGLIAVKAIEWELSDKPFLGPLIKKYFIPPFECDIDACCDSLMFLDLLGAKRQDDMMRLESQAFWDFIDFNQYAEAKKFYDWICNIKEIPEEFFVNYENEKKQLFLQTAFIQLTLEDSSILYFDGQLKNISDQKENLKSLFPFKKSVKNLSETIVSNKFTVIIYNISGENVLSVLKIIEACFNNESGKKVKNIAIFDNNNKEITKFVWIPYIKRNFICGIRSDDHNSGNFLKKHINHTKTDNEIFCCSLNGRIVYYSILSEKISSSTAILVYKNGKLELEVILLTNKDINEPEAIINSYFNKCKEVLNMGCLSEQTEEKNFYSIKDILADYSQELFNVFIKDFFRNNKFSINDLFSNICNIKGQVIKNQKEICLNLHSSSQYNSELLNFLLTLNRNIKDYLGRLLKIELL